MVSHAMEDYVAAIWRLTRQVSSASTSEVARRLGVSAASTSHMFKRMAEAQLVEHREYAGVVLTEAGERMAAAYIRRHRLIERFLVDMLSIPWDQVDAIADQMEHTLPEIVLERLDQLLGSPVTCPHGHPIPDETGGLPHQPVQALVDLTDGATATVSRVAEHDPRLLTYLAELKMMPGATVKIVSWDPMGETVTIRVGASEHVLGVAIARSVYVSA